MEHLTTTAHAPRGTCSPGPSQASPDLFDDIPFDFSCTRPLRIPANRDQMFAWVSQVSSEQPGNLPPALAGLARTLGGPWMPPQLLHDMVQAVHARGADDAPSQARWPEAMQALAVALGGPDMSEEHRDALLRLASVPASLRRQPAWPMVEALARALGGTAMAPRHCKGLATVLRRDEHLATPDTLAALLHVLGTAPSCAPATMRLAENARALVAALSPPDPDLDGSMLLAGAVHHLRRPGTAGHSLFEMSPTAIDCLCDALIDRLASQAGRDAPGLTEHALHWLAVALGRLAVRAPAGQAVLACAYVRAARAVPSISPGRLGVIVLDLTEQALALGDGQGMDNPAIAQAIAQAMACADSLPAAHLLAWLRSVAQVAVPASGWTDPVAQGDRLAPLALAMFLPPGGVQRASVHALAAMALVSPWVPDEVIGGTRVQMLPLLTCIALAGRAGGPALTAMALGAGRGLGLHEDPQGPLRIAQAMDWLAESGVPLATTGPIRHGLELALDPSHLLDGRRHGLVLDDAQRVDWLEAACLLPRHAVATRPDDLLAVVQGLAIPDTHASLRHALIDRVLAGRQLPASVQGLRAAHRRHLADPAPQQLMDFYETVWDACGLRPLLRGELRDDVAEDWTRVMHDARQVACALLLDLQPSPGHPQPVLAAQLLAHVDGVCRTINRFLLPARQMAGTLH